MEHIIPSRQVLHLRADRASSARGGVQLGDVHRAQARESPHVFAHEQGWSRALRGLQHGLEVGPGLDHQGDGRANKAAGGRGDAVEAALSEPESSAENDAHKLGQALHEYS